MRKITVPFFLILISLAGSACQRREFVNAPEPEKTAASPVTTKMPKSEEEWKKVLTKDQFCVLREKATEPAFSGKYHDNKEKGMYVCAACKQELFNSDTKYDSGSGWPSFWDAIEKSRVSEKPDNSYGMKRVEVVCSRCGGHLGHIFEDGPKPTGLRYCINSAALEFVKKK